MKNEEKATSGANKKGRGFGSRNTVQREAFARTSKALNVLQVKFNCREGNKRRRFSNCVRVMTTYLSTKV